jgi:hypothetical protein
MPSQFAAGQAWSCPARQRLRSAGRCGRERGCRQRRGVDTGGAGEQREAGLARAPRPALRGDRLRAATARGPRPGRRAVTRFQGREPAHRDHPPCKATGTLHFFPHGLRKRRGSLLSKQGYSLAEIAERLGDTKVVTAEHYLYAPATTPRSTTGRRWRGSPERLRPCRGRATTDPRLSPTPSSDSSLGQADVLHSGLS